MALIDIDILEVKNPSQFTARILLPWEKEAYERAFSHWQDEMEMIEQNTIINHEIHSNDICAVKDKTDEQWYRVRVEKVLYTGKGQQASCYFVDSGGKSQLFPVHRLYKLPECYQKHEVPFQVRTLKLWGLQPLSLVIEATDTGIHVPQRPAQKWDPSAETYFSQMTKDCEKAKVLVKEQERSGKLQVILYLLKNGQLVNINDILIREEYACAVHLDSHSSGTMKGEETLTEQGLKQVLTKVQRFSHQKKYDSDTEAMSCPRGRFKVRPRPALGSRSGPRMDSGNGAGQVKSSPLPPAGPDTGPHSDCELVSEWLRRTADFRKIPVHYPSDSDSSSYSELQGFNTNSKNLKQQNSKVKVNDTYGLLANAVESATAGHVTHILPAMAQSAVPQASSAAGLSGARSSSMTSSAMGGVPPPSGKVSSAGRGRGLRKLMSGDVLRLVQSPHHPPAVSHGAVTETAGALRQVGDGAVSDTSSPSLIDAGKHHQNQNRNQNAKHQDVNCTLEHGGSVVSSQHAAEISNLRAMDLNQEADVSRTPRHTCSADCSQPAPVSVPSLRAIDLNMDPQMPHMEQQLGSEDPCAEESLCVQRQQRIDSQNKGESLLNLLGGQPTDAHDDSCQLKVPLVWRPDRTMPRPFLGTIAWGIHLPQPVFDVEEIQLDSIVKNYMLHEGFKTPRAIQAHTWPALSRGRHIIGITPRQSGKTTAYLPSLMSELLKFSKYQKLPNGMGPKAVILVPSCKKADEIQRYAHNIIGNQTTLRVLCIYGSGDHYVMSLLRGCDLLVATPHCLLRMLHSRYTHLDRLCHLVLDGAEVLVEEFSEEVREVMELFGKKLKEYKSLPVTRQVMVFGTRWSSAMADFQKAFQTDPVLVFASRLEASVYGRVEQVVHMCFEKMHLNTLKSLVEKLMDDPDRCRIIITTTAVENMIKIDQLLKSMSIFAHVIQSGRGVSDEDIKEQVDYWLDETGTAILVVTDDNVTELRLTGADTVVHFDLPNSQTKFGNRLALMLDFFHDSCSQPLSQKKRGVSHVLVTNTMLDNIESLHSFLLRSGATIPTPMTRLLNGMHQGRNEDPNRTLCQQLKQFGRCKNENKCECRHIVLPCDVVHDDSPEAWLPAKGTVKLRVLTVADTSHYYALLLEHQVPGQPRQDLQFRYTTFTMDMAMYLANERNQVPFVMEQGLRSLAAVKDGEGAFLRARVLAKLEATLKSGSFVEVFYVDEGRKDMVRPEQLLKLPPELQSVPPLAVEVYICRVKPVDGDTEWTHSSRDYVKRLLKDKDLIGNVILRMNNTLWLDPLAEQTRLENVKTSIISMIVRPDLLRHGLAHDNPDHVKNLYKACQGKIPIEKKLYKKYFNLQNRKEIVTETLRSDEEYHSVYISAVDDPHHFFIQKTSSHKQLENMQQDLQKYMSKLFPQQTTPDGQVNSTSPPSSPAAPTSPPHSSSTKPPEEGSPVDVTKTGSTTGLEMEGTEKTAGTAGAAAATSCRSSVASLLPKDMKLQSDDLEQGCVCVAKFAADGRWYRAQIVGKEAEGWRVFFVDHGERNVVGEADLCPIPDQFCKLPAQAIECGLAHIRPVGPVGEEWTDSSADLLWDLANTVIGDKKSLCAKVVTTERSEFAGATKYVIEVYDTESWYSDMSFSQELVWVHEATMMAEDSDLRDLFPKETFNSRRLYPNLDAKIFYLCAALYWAQEESKIGQVARLLSDVISNLTLRDDTALGYSGLKDLVRLIGYLKSSESLSTLLSALVKCITASPRLCEAVIGKQLMLKLVFCIEQARLPVVQLQAASAAAQLAKIDEFMPCLDQKEIMVAMMEMLLLEDLTPEMLKQVCTFLAYMLLHGTWGVGEAQAEQLVPAVFNTLAEVSDPDTLELLLSLLASLATHKHVHTFIVREKHTQQILNLMSEAPSQRCVFHCAQVCQCLCRAHRRNKRILLEGGLVLIIKELLEGGVQSPARQLCEELHAMLAVSVPRQEALSGLHGSSQPTAAGAAAAAAAAVAVDASDSPAVLMPLVKWSQNSFRVLLTVTVHGAKESDFTITDSSVHFRRDCGGEVYGFDYQLFDTVVPDKCRIMVHQGEVILSLAKDIKGRWSHLLSKKQKFAKLKVDFDKLVDSSDSDLEEPENILLTRKMQGFKVPENRFQNVQPYDEDMSNGSDSEEERLVSCSDDERFEDPTKMIDPVSVLDDLININSRHTETGNSD
ncbi:uncharacterized protein LOC143286162 [Babylonia areolata]|uniref:uncharacterized protein LOC143286162 n=1 Tax=Babylonia areolata TaxID=304850 RepID=UPI003FD337B5